MSTPLLQRVADRYFAEDSSTDPVLWAKERGIHLWSQQAEVARSVRDHRYTATKACHDSGKSFVASVIVCWWLDTHPTDEVFVVTTAPTAPQVKGILWREIQKHHRKLGLRGRITGGDVPEWKIGNALVGWGRKPADTDQDAFQGIHAKYVLVVIDEANGIPRQLWDAVDALATNKHARVLAIGNPDSPTSHFRKVCEPGTDWSVHTIDGLNTPNFREQDVEPYPDLKQYMLDFGIPFTTEEVPFYLRDYLLSPQWVAERMQRWGVHRSVDTEHGEVKWSSSPLWESKVRGMFPTDSSDGVIPIGWIYAAVARWQRWQEEGGKELPGRRIYGVDVAREGGDETAIATRQGHAILEPVVRMGAQDTMTTVARLRPRLDHVQSIAGIDVIGVGAGVYDRLRELGYSVQPFNSSESTKLTDGTGEFTFPNTRCAAWWNVREMLDPSAGSEWMLPPDDQLIADLAAPKWSVRAGAKLWVEDKESMKKRLGRSPDAGDAVVIAMWLSGAPSGGPVDDFLASYDSQQVTAYNASYGDDMDDIDDYLRVAAGDSVV